MIRATVLAALVLTASLVEAQAVGTLHIRVTLTDADGKSTPVPRHALLISDNPATAAPRLVTTGVDGTADVRLRPGNYTVESDRPVAFKGNAYQWTQIIDIVAGRDVTLDLTIKNAEVETGSAAAAAAPSLDAEPSLLLPRWQDSVVSVWSPTTRASGFVVDAKGLVATNQRAIGSATTAEVQLTATAKVQARVLLADSARDVAVLWINPNAVAAAKPIALACAQPKPAPADQQEIFALGVPLRGDKDMSSGTGAELVLTYGNEGGPVFTADGALVGLTSPADKSDKDDENKRGNSRIINTSEVCEVVAAAEKKMSGASPPPDAKLPIEPDWSLPLDAFKNAADHRAGSLSPYQASTATFDISFITPIMTYGAQYQSEQMSRKTRKGRDNRTIELEPLLVRPVMDFANWTEYVEEFPPVLLVRIAPKQVEGLLQKVARGAAYTQGVGLPPLTKPKAGFARMRVYCGDTEVTPIHPLSVEHRLPNGDAFQEGLYVFSPDALSPACANVKLVLYSDKDPQRGESQTLDPHIVQQIAQDFALYK